MGNGVRMNPGFRLVCFLLIAATGFSAERGPSFVLAWEDANILPPAAGQEESLGVAGPFAGVSNDALIVAGGANFEKPYWGQEKLWHQDIWVLEKNGTEYEWHTGFSLERPLAYGMSVSISDGVVCIGGADAQACYAEVFLLRWDRQSKTVNQESLPSLPAPCAYGSATVIGQTIYVAGGQRAAGLDSAMNNFWSLDLSKKGTDGFRWEQRAVWPGPERAFNSTLAQHNGKTDCIYVISGRRKAGQTVSFLNDVYEYNPVSDSWKSCAPVPMPVCAGPGVSAGQSHIFIFGGDDGSLFFKADELKDDHPGFLKDIWVYHTITDTWIRGGQMPQTQVTSAAIAWNDRYWIISGEIRPRVRSPKLLAARLDSQRRAFGAVNFTTLALYLAAMVAVGIYFTSRNKNTDDFFRGGQRLPGWAAGLSIFATMLSSITYIAIPAKVFATDWTFFVINLMAVATAPFVIFYILPFFRSIDATSAYEYLERRFNVTARLFASTSFVLFQIGRMAIVMFLPALALSAITSLSVQQCILIMGVLSVLYCTMGGLEAVIWTDSIQTIILLAGAMLSLIVVLLNIDGGVGQFLAVAADHQKFHAVNLDFSSTSFMTTALWVMVLGGIGQSLVPYVSDQAVVQRYLSVSDMKTARTSILTNAVIIIPASLLVFGIGTALFVFYKMHPEKLDPTFQNDAIFPLFIARELPIGISGLVVAGIFAAAQSTVSTSMNSISTVVVTDFVKRFSLLKTERGYLNLARFCTFFFGVLGTGLALLFASADIKSLWESFMSVLGLFGGSMCGLFLLGIFTRRVGAGAAILGAVFSAAVLFVTGRYTATSGLLYASIGIAACVLSGYLLSFVLSEKPKDLTGLTLFTVRGEECVRN